MKYPVLCVTFDDFRLTDFTKAFPELINRDGSGTSYIIGKRLEDNGYHGAARGGNATIAHIMHRYGWDLGCHTYDHANINELTPEEVSQNMINQNSAFSSAGLPTPENHAHPWGYASPTAKNIIANFRKTQRNTGYDVSQINYYDVFDNKNVKGLKADLATESDLNIIKDAIDSVALNKQALVVYTHTIVDSDPAANECSLDYFRQMLDYAIAKGLRIVNMRQLNNILRYAKGDLNWV